MSDGRLDPDTPIHGVAGGPTVGDFWAWAFSNVLTNNLRGIFAEFLVGTALGILEAGRTEWDAFDLIYREEGIEVKSSAYLQSWDQGGKPSAIGWNIAEHYSFDPETGDWTKKKGRSAKCYVLCVYTEREDRSPSKVLDLDRWEFYVLPTAVIDRELATQKTVGHNRIKSLAEAVPYSRLKERVDEALAHGGHGDGGGDGNVAEDSRPPG